MDDYSETLKGKHPDANIRKIKEAHELPPWKPALVHEVASNLIKIAATYPPDANWSARFWPLVRCRPFYELFIRYPQLFSTCLEATPETAEKQQELLQTAIERLETESTRLIEE